MIKLEAQLMIPSASSGGKIEKTLQKDAGTNTLCSGSLGQGTTFVQLDFFVFVLFWVLALFEVQLFSPNRFYFLGSQKNCINYRVVIVTQTKFLLLLISCITVVHLLTVDNQHLYVVTNSVVCTRVFTMLTVDKWIIPTIIEPYRRGTLP